MKIKREVSLETQTPLRRVLHQEYLQMWLNGVELEVKIHGNWYPYSIELCSLGAFDCKHYEFRKKPKLVKVDIDKFKYLIHNSSMIYSDEDEIIEHLSECIVEE